MEFKTKNILKIIDKYNINDKFYNTEENRKSIINELNDIFFYDNIAKFIDYTKDDADHLSIVIEYKDTHYNILAYKMEVRQRVERIRKLNKLEKISKNQ